MPCDYLAPQHDYKYLLFVRYAVLQRVFSNSLAIHRVCFILV